MTLPIQTELIHKTIETLWIYKSHSRFKVKIIRYQNYWSFSSIPVEFHEQLDFKKYNSKSWFEKYKYFNWQP